MTHDELRDAEAAYRAASRLAERLRGHRNALLREALAEGWTHAAVAEATGLTRSRVGQLRPTALAALHAKSDDT